MVGTCSSTSRHSGFDASVHKSLPPAEERLIQKHGIELFD